MKVNSQKALRTIAAAGCLFIGSSAVIAQSDESDDSQQRQNQSQDREQSRDQNKQSQKQSRTSESADQQRSRGNEPWENRSSSSQRSQSGRNWNDDSSNRQNSGNESYGQQDSQQAGLGISFSTENQEPVVRQVHRGSPAEEMGLRQGDRITQVNGEEVRTARDVIKEVQRSEPGDDIEIEVSRNGDEQSFEGELETRSDALVLRTGKGRQQNFGGGYASQGISNHGDRHSYSVRGGDNASHDSRGRSGGAQQDAHRQLESLERQVQQINREIEQLRRSLDGRADSQGQTERQAGYSEYDNQRGDEVRTSYSDGGQAQDGVGGRTHRDGPRGQESDQDNSPGGVVGGARTRPDSNWIDNQ